MLSLFNFPNNLKSLFVAIPEESVNKDFANEFLEYLMKFKSMDKITLMETLNLSEEQMECLLNGEQIVDEKIMDRIKKLVEGDS